MKNAIYIIGLILSTSFVLSAQISEPLSTSKNNTEHYNNNNNQGNNGYDNRRGGDYNQRNDNRYNNNGRNNNSNNSRYGNDNRYGNNNNNNNRHGGGYYGNNGHGHNNGHHAGNGHGHNNGHHAGHGHGHGHNNGHGHGHTVSNRHGHRYVGFCNYTNHNYGWAPVTISIFNTGCQRIRHCNFESDRLREAMAFVNHNYVSAHQIANIMHYFDFESSKLEFAKYAFHRTCDIQNYGVVFNEFTFNSSRRELDCYIRDYHW